MASELLRDPCCSAPFAVQSFAAGKPQLARQVSAFQMPYYHGNVLLAINHASNTAVRPMFSLAVLLVLTH